MKTDGRSDAQKQRKILPERFGYELAVKSLELLREGKKLGLEDDELIKYVKARMSGKKVTVLRGFTASQLKVGDNVSLNTKTGEVRKDYD